MRLLGALALTAVYLSPSSATAKPLVLDDVLATTRRHHPKVAEAVFMTRAAAGKVLEGRSFSDPTVKGKVDASFGDYSLQKADIRLQQRTSLWGLTLDGGWRLGAGDFPIYKKDLETSELGQAFIGLRLPILRGGPIDAGRAKLWRAQHLKRAADASASLVRLELARQAAYRYWFWVLAGRSLAIAQAQLAIAKTRVAQIKARIKRGDLPPIAAIENERAMLKREGSVIKAQRKLQQAAFKLALYYRDKAGRPLTPRASQLPKTIGVPPSLPAKKALSSDQKLALAKRPETVVLNAERRAVAVTERLAANARLPRVDLFATAGYDLGSEPFEKRRGEIIFGLSWKLAVLQRKARGARENARQKGRAIEAKRRLLADKIALQVKDVYSAISAAKRALSVATRELSVAKRVETAERRRFALGASSMLTVNLREQATAQAERRVAGAKTALQLALADYRAITARQSRSFTATRN
jgi:cobalt-zinc-cadmium efflux system outer membrane protein